MGDPTRNEKENRAAWLDKVSEILEQIYGWHIGDLPDYRWKELHDKSMSPRRAVDQFLMDWCNQTRIQSFYGFDWWSEFKIRVDDSGARIEGG